MDKEALARLIDTFSVSPFIGIRDKQKLCSEILIELDQITSLIPPRSSIIDIGTGAGLPGIPIAADRPDCRVLLIDSAVKKIRWAAEAARRLGLENVETRPARAETAAHEPDLRGRFDAATAKAVAPLRVVIEYALPFLRLGGLCIAPRGREARREVEEAGPALEALGGRVIEVRPYRLPHLAHDRHLVVVEAVRPAPARYPRRPGIPLKRPL